jgi:biotin carboxyl carrier protein
MVNPLPTGAPANHVKAVLAPIPGVIISVGIKEGEAVATGQELCVLEAMKMKNSIRAKRAGKICAVRVTPGEQVRHSQVLMEFAD